MKLRLFLLLVLAGFGQQAHAGAITYSDSVTLTGSLGGTAFTNAAVSFSMATSTASDTPGGGGTFFTNYGPLTVTVPGIGTATFTDADIEAGLVFYLNPSQTNFYFSDISASEFIFGTLASGDQTYGGLTSFGPVSGSPLLNSGSSFATTDGTLVLNGASGTSTFTAVASSAPEPTTLALASVCAAGMLGARFRRRRRVHCG